MTNIVSALVLMLILGAACGLILGFASNVFRVEVDHRVEDVTGLLPGYNCGGCGYAGCSGMAAALCAGEADVSKCKPSKAEQKEVIKQYLKDHPANA